MKDLRLRGVILITVGVLAAITASAGTMFRLEVGPPVAAGVNYKLKNAVMVTRALVCADFTGLRVNATAEGLVNGQRRSVSLQLMPVSDMPGVYAVLHQWPDEGKWIVHLTGSCPSPKAEASTLVPMRGSTFIREKVKVLTEPATRKQIEAALADAAQPESR